MKGLSYDPAKRAVTLEMRGLDFEEAPEVFSGITFDRRDDRRDYGEERFITIGRLRSRMVDLVWTPRDGKRHIFDEKSQ